MQDIDRDKGLERAVREGQRTDIRQRQGKSIRTFSVCLLEAAEHRVGNVDTDGTGMLPQKRPPNASGSDSRLQEPGLRVDTPRNLLRHTRRDRKRHIARGLILGGDTIKIINEGQRRIRNAQPVRL